MRKLGAPGLRDEPLKALYPFARRVGRSGDPSPSRESALAEPAREESTRLRQPVLPAVHPEDAVEPAATLEPPRAKQAVVAHEPPQRHRVREEAASDLDRDPRGADEPDAQEHAHARPVGARCVSRGDTATARPRQFTDPPRIRTISAYAATHAKKTRWIGKNSAVATPKRP